MLFARGAFLSSSGEMYFDNMLLYDQAIMGIQDLNSSLVKVYPNPVSDVLHVSTASLVIPLLQLYSISGVLLREVSAKEMNVNDITAGTYVLKVKLAEYFMSYPVMIVR